MKTYKRRIGRKKRTQKRKRGGTRTSAFLSSLIPRRSVPPPSVPPPSVPPPSVPPPSVPPHKKNPFKIGIDKMIVDNYYIIFFKIPTRTDDSAEVPDYSVEAYNFFRGLNLNSYDITGYIRSFSFVSDGFRKPFLIKYLGPEKHDYIKVGLNDNEFIFPKTKFFEVIDKLIPIDIAEFREFKRREFKRKNNGGVDTVVNTTNNIITTNNFLEKIKSFLTRHTTNVVDVEAKAAVEAEAEAAVEAEAEAKVKATGAEAAAAAATSVQLNDFYKDFNSIKIQDDKLLKIYFKTFFKELVLIAREKGIPEEVMEIIVSYLLQNREQNHLRVRH